MLLVALGAWTTFRWTCCLLLLGLLGDAVQAMSRERRIELREQVRALFRHGYEGYLTHAWPADELHPISCTPRGRNWANPADFGRNDVSPNASMTLLDTLTSLPIVLPSALPDALERITSTVSWDQDAKVQVFELTIRGLGSLLSTYQYLDTLPASAERQAEVLGLSGADGEAGRGDVRRYRWKVLALARDLAERLMPAFETPTGIPYARVNLRHGVEPDETQETCTAGAGSLILEFGVLSRLTADPKYEEAAQRAFLAIWNRRSDHDLLGNTIGALHGQWLSPGMSGVPAGMDSYFEYALKAYILLGDDMYLDVFADAYSAIQTHVRTQDGFIYRPVQLRSLLPNKQSTIDSLSAFFPGVQVLYGNVESAIKNHMVHWNLWRRYSGSPESWDIGTREAEWKGWPLRPEFTESTMYLHRATGDDFYLRVGERVLHDLENRAKTDCGFAVLRNVETGELEDRMESFVLSELLKYLFLLFDPEPVTLSNSVFSTEAHPLSLPHSLLKTASPTRRALRKNEDQYCPAYERTRLGGRPGSPPNEGLVVGIEQRLDWEYGRSLVFGFGVNSRVGEDGHVHWRPYGFCEVPLPPRYAMEVPLTPNISNLNAADEPPPLRPYEFASLVSNIQRDPASGDLVVYDTRGLSMQVRWRLDQTGYDVAKVGPHRVLPGQHVLVADPTISPYIPLSAAAVYESALNQPEELVLRLSRGELDGNSDGRSVFLHAAAATATFGHAFAPSADAVGGGWTISAGPIRLVRPQEGNEKACRSLQRDLLRPSSPLFAPEPAFVVLAERGDCTFLQKALLAGQSNAAGLLIVGYPERPAASGTGAAGGEQGLFRPSADGESEVVLRMVEHVGVVYAERAVGDQAEAIWRDGGEVWVEGLSVEAWAGEAEADVGVDRDEDGAGENGDGVGNQPRGGTRRASTSGGGGGGGGGRGGAAVGRKGQRDETEQSDPTLGGKGRRARKEGRMFLGEWEIWNLRVVDPVDGALEGLDRPP